MRSCAWLPLLWPGGDDDDDKKKKRKKSSEKKAAALLVYLAYLLQVHQAGVCCTYSDSRPWVGYRCVCAVYCV